MRIIAFVLVLVAARTADAGDCVPPDATVDNAQLASDAAIVCYDRCWRLDYATGAWKTVAPPPPRPAEPAPTGPNLRFATKARLCTPDCHDVTIPGVAAINERDVAESADRALLAVQGVVTASGAPPIQIFDAASGAVLAKIPPWKTSMGDPSTFQRVAFVGRALYVAVSSSPVSSSGRLYDPRTGKRLAIIGGSASELDESVALDLGRDQWAFAAFDSNELYVHDVTTGRRAPSIRSGPREGGYSTLEIIGNRLVGVRTQASSGVLLYDLAQHKATHHRAPACN